MNKGKTVISIKSDSLFLQLSCYTEGKQYVVLQRNPLNFCVEDDHGVFRYIPIKECDIVSPNYGEE